MGEYTPDFIIPEHGIHLWEWFKDLNHVASHATDGECKPILPSEYNAWLQLTGNIVNSVEYDILKAMDLAYCEEMNLELRSRREQHYARKQKEAELNSRKR